jgi:hypothetical protein
MRRSGDSEIGVKASSKNPAARTRQPDFVLFFGAPPFARSMERSIGRWRKKDMDMVFIVSILCVHKITEKYAFLPGEKR